MAWTTPPTFTSGNILTAAQLNILSDDQEHLYGLAQSPNLPIVRAGGAAGVTDKYYIVRHRLQYLNVRATWDKGSDPGSDFSLTVYYDGTSVISQSLGGTTETTTTYQADLDSSPSPTVGNWYEIEIDAATNSYSGTYLYIDAVWESES